MVVTEVIIFRNVIPCSLVQVYHCLKEHGALSLKMEAISSSEISVSFCQNPKHHFPADRNVVVCEKFAVNTELLYKAGSFETR